MKLIFDRYQFF